MAPADPDHALSESFESVPTGTIGAMRDYVEAVNKTTNVFKVFFVSFFLLFLVSLFFAGSTHVVTSISLGVILMGVFALEFLIKIRNDRAHRELDRFLKDRYKIENS